MNAPDASARDAMPTADLPALASEINAEIEAAERDARSAVGHARRAGDLLREAKVQLRHGEWLPWLRANCPLAERTAQAYMRLARRLAELPDEEAQRVADLPLRGAMALLAEPRLADGADLTPTPTPGLDAFQQTARFAIETLGFLVEAAGPNDLRVLHRIASASQLENAIAEINIFSARMVGSILLTIDDDSHRERLDGEHRRMQERCIARAEEILADLKSLVSECSPALRARLEWYSSDDTDLPAHALRFHEFVSVCPLMSDEEIESLARSIGDVGLLRPITVYRGQILDGRCRALAFTRHPDLAPASAWREREFTGTDDEALAYVKSMNICRAHIPSGQRAGIAATATRMMEQA